MRGDGGGGGAVAFSNATPSWNQTAAFGSDAQYGVYVIEFAYT